MVKKILAQRFLLIIIALVLIGGFVFYNTLLKPKGPAYITEKAVKGTVVKEISDTGTVRSNDKIEMSFKGIGKISNIYVKNNDLVKAGQELVKLDTSDLQNQLKEAYADLEVSQAKTHDDLNTAYANGLDILNDAYTKTYTAYNAAYQIQQEYFREYSGYGGTVIESEQIIKVAGNNIKSYLEEISLLSGNEKNKKIESVISQSKQLVSNCLTAISSILDIVRSAGFRDEVSDTNKALLETQRTNLNTLYTNLSSAQQDISTITSSGASGISLYEAQIIQAQAKISTLKSQINDSTLKSPIDGRIVELDKKSGETIQAKETVVSVISNSYFEVKVNIYEGDIADIRIGNTVQIELVAFPDQKISGKVVSIDPSEKLVDDVVYYETTISLDSEPEGIKEGMTADVVVQVAKKENVLMVPKKGIEKINGERIAKVLKSGKIEEVKVQVGLEGTEYTEIISGLNGGEDIVVGNKI